MNTRESAGVKELESQRDILASRAAEYAGLLAETGEQLAAAVKTIESILAEKAKLTLTISQQANDISELQAQLPDRPVAIQDDRN